jgi:hypothetical protein
MSPSDDSSLVNCYDLAADAGRLTARTVNLDPLKADTDVARLLDSVGRSVDSIAGQSLPLPPGSWTSQRLVEAVVKGLLGAKLADGFLCDSLFVADFKEPVDVGTLVGLLRDPGRLAILTVPGDGLSDWPEELVLRPGLSRPALSRVKTYRIATTVDYLQRNPRLAAAGFELSARPLWTMCRDILESGRVK